MPILLTERALRRVFPNARKTYIDAILKNQDFLDKYGIKDDAQTWSQFVGQIGAETDGLTIVRESMYYTTTARLLQIFGARHSARVTKAEAVGLLRNPKALGERVYGLGNPSMASRLGNIKEGDGYNYRGWGPGQVTGREQTLKYGRALGLDLEAKPELLEDADVGLKAFVLEWDHRGLNKWAKRGDLLAVSRGVNLGSPTHSATPNGLDHRKAWNRKAWAEWRDAPADGTAPKPKPASIMVLRFGDHGAEVYALQDRLVSLGYAVGEVDGDFGIRTRRAVASFQIDHDLEADGKVGPLTWTALRQAEPITTSTREMITAADLAARGSQTIGLAFLQQRRGLWTLGSGVVTWALALVFPDSVAGLPDWISRVASTTEAVKQGLDLAATPIGAVVMAGGILCALGAVFLVDGKKAEMIRVKDAQTGANLSK